MNNKIEIYKNPDNQTEIQVQFEEDTVWLSQLQMADLFDKDVRQLMSILKTFIQQKNWQ